MPRRDGDGWCRLCNNFGEGVFCDCDELRDYVDEYTLNSLEVMLVHEVLSALYDSGTDLWRKVSETGRCGFASEDHDKLRALLHNLTEVVTDG